MQSTSILLCPFTALLPLALLLVGTVGTYAQTVIKQVPYTITTPGNYVLSDNFSYNASNGSAIFVDASNVQLNFNGFFISNRAAGAGTSATGVAIGGVNNVTVANGTLSGFNIGISANEYGNESGQNYGHVIQNMRLIDETSIGMYLVNTHGSCIVEQCQIIGVGSSGASSAYGILLDNPGASTEILNTSITGAGTSGGKSYGIYFINGPGILRANRISYATEGIYMAGDCKYQDNLTTGCTTAFSGGTDVGGNN